MEFSLKNGNLKIVYEKHEWERLENVHRSLGLELSNTQNAWKVGKRTTFYKDTLHQFYNFTHRVPNVWDNINDTPIAIATDGIVHLNIAVFRVVPSDLEVNVPISELLSASDWSRICQLVREVLSRIFSIVTEAKYVLKIKVEE